MGGRYPYKLLALLLAAIAFAGCGGATSSPDEQEPVTSLDLGDPATDAGIPPLNSPEQPFVDFTKLVAGVVENPEAPGTYMTQVGIHAGSFLNDADINICAYNFKTFVDRVARGQRENARVPNNSLFTRRIYNTKIDGLGGTIKVVVVAHCIDGRMQSHVITDVLIVPL